MASKPWKIVDAFGNTTDYDLTEEEARRKADRLNFPHTNNPYTPAPNDQRVGNQIYTITFHPPGFYR